MATMCRVWGVFQAATMGCRQQLPSPRARVDEKHISRINLLIRTHARPTEPLGHAELAGEGIHAGRKRVARLMANGRPALTS